ACAAAISSSGLVLVSPAARSERAAHVIGRVPKAPLAGLTVPLPFIRSPSHVASARLVAAIRETSSIGRLCGRSPEHSSDTADPRFTRGMVTDAAELREEGLVYSSDTEPGIRRARRGRGFAYLDPDGKAITDKAVLERIRSLAIPPAWTDVWI